jgi:tetratricopeptide (TPR) repeat protein
LLHGTTLGLELVKEFQVQTQSLINYAELIVLESESTFTKVHTELCKIDVELQTILCRVDKIEATQIQHERSIDNLNDKTEEITASLASVQSAEVENKQFIQDLDGKQRKTTQQVQKMGLDISEIKEDIEEIKQTNSGQSPRGKVFFFPPNRVEHFVGRRYELKKLKEGFFTQKNGYVSQAISGLGGCGKTTLSIEFAWLFQEMYPGGVFWMSAESNETLQNSISKLAIFIDTVGKNSKETLNKTLKWLSLLERRWLLVLDNVDGEEVSGNIKELVLGAWKHCSCGHFIITSRRNPTEINESFNISDANCIFLESLSDAEAKVFLQKRTGCSTEDSNDHIAELVIELGGLPLVLEQAGAHIKALNCTFEQYIERFKKKRLKLLRPLRDKSIDGIQKNRLDVTTTWQLNIEYIKIQSKNEDLGSAAITVMEIVSFLFADNIPVDIINVGMPQIDDDDFIDALQDSLGVKQIVEILTRFSLFRKCDQDTLSVHRLVQEVIRNNIDDPIQLKRVLGYATRMVNKALQSNESPYNTLVTGNGESDMRGSLYMWGKLAENSNVLKRHLIKFSQKFPDYTDVFFNEETCKILQSSGIYHSINQRQDEALSDQDQMLHVIASLNLTGDKAKELTSIQLPLFEKDRIRIQNCIAAISCEDVPQNGSVRGEPVSTDQLRILGNEAYQENRMEDAIRYYSEAITASPKETIDHCLLSNRSLLYLIKKDYVNALVDAEKCIEINPCFCKGYYRKACAIAKLIKRKMIPAEMESAGFASACIAASLNKDYLLEYKMKINDHVINCKFVTEKNNLGDAIAELTGRPFTTYILQKGHYYLEGGTLVAKSVQIIGLGTGVHIDIRDGLFITPFSVHNYGFELNCETNITVHFENVNFPAGCGQIIVNRNVVVTFYRCMFSNGLRGCDSYPDCTGGKGCINPIGCRQIDDLSMLGDVKSGKPGCAAICARLGGKVFIEKCIFERCGGGGVLCTDDGTVMEIKRSTFSKNRQMGIEARNGGRVIAVDNVIANNQTHGVAIGPRGSAILERNIIENNNNEGIWCGGSAKNDNPFFDIPKEVSKAVIRHNIISHNGLSGILLNGGIYDLYGNKILDNWLWGIVVKSQSSANIINNDIFENKCGGIRIGINYSASVILDGNTIHDHHTGPAIDTPSIESLESCIAGMGLYSKPVLITNRNFFQNNEKGQQHPTSMIQLVKTCCYCHIPNDNLLTCTKCRKATYCSKICQAKHWSHHKSLCKLIFELYTVEIKMSETQSFNEFVINTIGGERTNILFIHDPKRIKDREGPRPDRKTSKCFVVKIQACKEYVHCNPKQKIMLYDKTLDLHIVLSNPQLYHLLHQCGVLETEKFTIKAFFCNASFKQNGTILCIQTDNLPPYDKW